MKAGYAVNLIAQLSLRTGISPLDLLDTPVSIVDEMVRLLLEENEQRERRSQGPG